MTVNAFYESLKERLRLLMASVDQLLTLHEREQVSEFIEVNELGVALETLIGYLVEARHPVPQRIANDAKRLAADMELNEAFLDGLTIRSDAEND